MLEDCYLAKKNRENTEVKKENKKTRARRFLVERKEQPRFTFVLCPRLSYLVRSGQIFKDKERKYKEPGIGKGNTHVSQWKIKRISIKNI